MGQREKDKNYFLSKRNKLNKIFLGFLYLQKVEKIKWKKTFIIRMKCFGEFLYLVRKLKIKQFGIFREKQIEQNLCIFGLAK